MSLTFDKREVLALCHGAATEVTPCGLTENLFKLMTDEVNERVLKTFEVVSTADFFRMPAVVFVFFSTIFNLVHMY